MLQKFSQEGAMSGTLVKEIGFRSILQDVWVPFSAALDCCLPAHLLLGLLWASSTIDRFVFVRIVVQKVLHRFE